MKFRKGNKVEIHGDTEKFAVEWHCARIISGNGHTYRVQYDSFIMTTEADAERVPRKAIRPCPPLIESTKQWEIKDIVEVYDKGSWKAATVLKNLGGHFYLVRLLVSCKELEVHKINTRVRQSWENEQWIVKPVKPVGPGNYGIGKCSRNLISNSYRMMPEVQQAKKLDSSGLNETFLASPSMLKRASPHGSPAIEDYPRKKRFVVNQGEWERLTTISTDQLLEKVDAIAYPQYYETRKENPCSVRPHFPETYEEPYYSCSNLSSVGSCSVISSGNNSFDDTLAGPCQDDDSLCSDAESLDVRDMDMDMDEGCTIPPKEVVAERIHRLELNAYNDTLQAMYASGHLSWEKEELLTNLRISLNISNDEHLMGIKDLVSAGQNF